MAQQANLKTINIAGEYYSASGEWTIQFGGHSKDVRANLDETLDWKYVPEPDVWSGPVSFPGGISVEELIAAQNIIATAILRNGTVVQLTSGVIQNHTELDTDGGEWALELAGRTRTLEN